MRATWLSLLWMAATSMPGWGQSQLQERFALTAGQVAQALSDHGVPTTGEQVSLLARVVATQPNPVLDIVSVEPSAQGQPAPHSPARSQVKLTCHLPGECLPFYAIVSWSESAAREATNTFDPSALSAKGEIIMRVGTRATLIIDDNRSHIQVAVISLQNGMAGHRIRVTSPDHKQVYFGEVVSASLLKASF
jgi:hypothetical protein